MTHVPLVGCLVAQRPVSQVGAWCSPAGRLKSHIGAEDWGAGVWGAVELVHSQLTGSPIVDDCILRQPSNYRRVSASGSGHMFGAEVLVLDVSHAAFEVGCELCVAVAGGFEDDMIAKPAVKYLGQAWSGRLAQVEQVMLYPFSALSGVEANETVGDVPELAEKLRIRRSSGRVDGGRLAGRAMPDL
jgi:hypothetical protein